MNSRKLWIGLVALIVLGAGWYAFRPERLWVNQTVNESLDAGAMPASTSAMTAATEPAMKTTEPVAYAMGTFHKGAHDTKGVATIYTVGGKHVLRLTNFETSNGPDVHVFLVKAMDATDNATVTKSGYVDVASLKGNVGDQNYDLPADLDVSQYGAVTIWCKRFGVNFGTAPLAHS